MGSLYTSNTKNMQGDLLKDKAGNPRQEFWFNIAVAKGSETHWNQTPWGAIIYDKGAKGYPNGQFKSNTFSWKILDGDSTEVNKEGNRPCDHEGYPGHWILRFKSGFAPIIVNEDASPCLLPAGSINCGDYIQVFGTVSPNNSPTQPGVYLNFTHVAFLAYGQKIVTTIDPKSIGFGGAPLPAGASKTPVLQGMPQPASTVTPPPTPPPYHGVLQPKLMLPAANGIPYDAYIKEGWTDTLLIQHGYMQA
jgi:hypothetical protein